MERSLTNKNSSCNEIEACHNLIKKHIHNTPILTSRLLNEITGANLYFKCENFQRMGAFKMRGATHAIMKLTNTERQKGVVTHSSGNFAQALALAAQSLNVKAYIIMPSTAPNVKKQAVIGYGAQIIECEPNLMARESMAKKIESETGARFIHPSNNYNVILGQGTACLELMDQINDLDAIICPVGGGGLIAGTALAAKYHNSNCTILGAEPYEVDDAYRSLKSGKIESNNSTNTIADGLKTQLGDINFPIIKNGVNKIIRVEEQEIKDAMLLIWERMKIIIEPSSAVAFAAVLKAKNEFKNKKLGIIISGGNVDLKNTHF
ncbi:MAG: threonine/serine dehydratase [Marinifilaceae bacterium]|jgi:threonine dehydratase|nr:threonine/serine dehydratase [Marinifilaceae bacterium]